MTEAYAIYKKSEIAGLTFFAFLVWHLAQTLQGHLSFKLRKLGEVWVVLDNAPIVIPVAVGGAARFSEVLIENAAHQSLLDMSLKYRNKLDAARRGEIFRMNPEVFLAACFVGNLPSLQFSALNLHWRKSMIQCQPAFYFGKRYAQGDRLFIPLAAKLHHACTDPYVFNALIEDFNRRFQWV